MIGYKYNEFEIKIPAGSSFYTIFKDGYPFSSLACSTAQVAKRVLDRTFPKNKDSKLIPIIQESEKVLENELIVTSCECGCGEAFIKDVRGKKRFIQGHNNNAHYKKVNNIWNKKINKK